MHAIASESFFECGVQAMMHTRRRLERRPVRRYKRALCRVLAFLQVWVAVPAPPARAAQASTPVKPGAETAAQPTSADKPKSAPISHANPRERVVVNRTVPVVTPPPLEPVFTADPTDKELTESRIFSEPLARVGRVTLPGENRALANAVTNYLASRSPETVLPFLAFLKIYPDSPWRASLLLNLGLVYRRTGYFTKALDTWEQVWAMTNPGDHFGGR